jgi:hypothetical protein
VRFVSTQHAVVSLFITLAASQALAEEPRLAVSASARPMAIGRFNLLLGAEPGIALGGTANVPQVVLPLRFGITDDLELFAGPVAQPVDPIFHEPAIGALYRLVGGPVEIGARLAGDLSLFGAVKTATLQLGVPLRIHAGNALAIDVGAHALIGVLPQTVFGVLVPAGVSLNLTDNLFVGAASGVKIPDFSNTGALGIPLAATAGYTVAWGDRPFLDLAARAGWDDVRASWSAFTVGASARLYLYF